MHRLSIPIIAAAALLLLAACTAVTGPPAAPSTPEATKPQGSAVTAVTTAAVTAVPLAAASALPVAPSPPPPTSAPPTSVGPAAASSPASSPALAAASVPTKTPALAGTLTPAPSATSGPAWAVETLLVAPGEPGRLYALVADSTGPLWASPASSVRLRISDDFGKTWSDFPGGLPVDAECMVNVNLDYAGTDALYASTCQGIFVWEGGAGWAKRSEVLTNVIAVAFGQPDLVWAAKAGDGVIRSDDGGRTWRDASTGLVTFGGMANLGFDPRDNRTLYGIIQPRYAGSYLRRGTSEGNWQTLPAPQNNATIETGMTIDGGSGALYVTTQAPPSGLWVSRNANAADLADVQWGKIRDFDATARVLLLASGWGPDGTALYANIWPDWYEDGAAPATGGLNRSLDGGYTWEALPMP